MPMEKKEVHGNLGILFQSPLSLLTILIGLAAYTSTILTKLRETVTDFKKDNATVLARELTPTNDSDSNDEKTRKKVEADEKDAAQTKLTNHRNNYTWLLWVDRLIVFTGVILIVTIADWSRGVVCDSNQLLIVAMLLVIVLYFAGLHIRQWMQYANVGRK